MAFDIVIGNDAQPNSFSVVIGTSSSAIIGDDEPAAPVRPPAKPWRWGAAPADDDVVPQPTPIAADESPPGVFAPIAKPWKWGLAPADDNVVPQPAAILDVETPPGVFVAKTKPWRWEPPPSVDDLALPAAAVVDEEYRPPVVYARRARPAPIVIWDDALPIAPASATPPGPTIDQWETGDLSGKWVVAIEGYPYLLTDATPTQATTAWSGTDFVQALHGLYIGSGLANEQALSPWEPFPSGGRLTLRVVQDENDTFGIDTHKNLPTSESLMTATVDADDTTFTLKSASSFASSGTAYCGSEAIGYANKSGTQLQVLTRGKFAPFGCDPSGSGGDRFGRPHAIATDTNAINLQPVVASDPRSWIGKWVGLWAHRIDVPNSLLNVKDDALLCFAGRITEIRDQADPMCTQVEVQHILDVVKDCTIGVDPWSAKLVEGVNVPVGGAFEMIDFSDTFDVTTKLVANPLVVVSGAPASANEIQGGVTITTQQLCDKINAWLAAERAAGRLNGGYSLGIKQAAINGESRAVMYFQIPGTAGDFVGWRMNLPSSVNKHLGTFVIVDHEQPASAQPGTPHDTIQAGAGHTANNIELTPSTGIPFRNSINPNYRFELYDERNTFFDQSAYLPGQLSGWANQPANVGPKAILKLDSWLFGVVYTAGSPSALTHFVPYQSTGTGSTDSIFHGDNYLITVDDPRGPIEVTQVFVLEGTFGDIVKQIFYSTGTVGYNHSTLDVLPAQMAIGIPGILLGDNFETSVDLLPGADAAISLTVEKPKKLADILGGDLIVRWAFLRWAHQSLQFWTWSTPINGITLTEDNKGSPVNVDDEQRSISALSDKEQRNLIKLQYNRDSAIPDNAGYRNTEIVVDRVAIDDAGRIPKPITISLANTFSQHTASGAGIQDLLPRFMAVAPLFTHPGRRTPRTMTPDLFEQLTIGDTVVVSDNFARDPDTGRRGTTARPGIITRHFYTPGGAMPGGEVADMHGELEIMFRDVDRHGLLVPAAMVDDTAANAGWDAANGFITLYAHKFSESGENADVTWFPDGSIVRVIEIDPADPTNPLVWSGQQVALVGGNVLELSPGLGIGPAWDNTKKYRVIYDHYASCIAAQQARFAFFADDTDARVEDLRVPYEYAINSHLGGGAYQIDPVQWPPQAPTANVPDDDVELPPDNAAVDGAGVDVGTNIALNRLINSLMDYKTTRSAPWLQSTEMSGAAATGTYKCVEIRCINLGEDNYLLKPTRKYYVAPFFKSSDGTTATCRVSLCKSYPQQTSPNADVDRGFVYGEATFSTTSATYTTPSAVGIPLGNIKGMFGRAYLVIELTVKARCMGLGYAQEGPREQ
jgi:hypothetical protein